MLCALPGWRALRKAAPHASITLLSLPWARCFVDRFPNCFDDFITFPGHPDFPEQEANIEQWPDFLRTVQKARFDLVIQQQGNGSIANAFCRLFGARYCGGFHNRPITDAPVGNFIPYPVHMPEIWRHLCLMRELGAASDDDTLEFPVYETDRAQAMQVAASRGLDPEKPFVCLHPGAKAPDRRWPAAHFAETGRWLAAAGWQVVITGSEAEKPLAHEVCGAMQGTGVDMSGATPDIGTLAALLEASSLLVCGDTGVSHLACAVRCPSVVVFTRPETQGWPPLDRVRHRVLAGLGGVAAGRVIREIDSILRPSRGSVSVTEL